jgi:outer membrane protein
MLLASMALLAGAQGALADTLDEAMSTAVETNPSLAAQRQRLRAAREALPQALSEALPQVSVGGLAARTDRDGEGPLIDTPPTEAWSASANASQLLFGSGRVLATTRAARAQNSGAAAE